MVIDPIERVCSKFMEYIKMFTGNNDLSVSDEIKIYAST